MNGRATDFRALNRALSWLVAVAVTTLVWSDLTTLVHAADPPAEKQADSTSPDLSGFGWLWNDPDFEPRRIDDDERELPISVSRLFVPRWRLAGGPQVKAAFREAVDDAAAATVCIHCDGRHVAYGGVVGSNGWVVTKASQLRGAITCILPSAGGEGSDGDHQQGAEHAARIAAVDSQLDLALLKIEATGLPTLDLSHEAAPAVGSFLATAGVGRDPVAVGVVSVRARAVRAKPAVLGVQLDEWAQPPQVVEVFRGSAAARAGLRAGDRITSLDGVSVLMREQLIRIVREHTPGQAVKIGVERGEQKLVLEATLADGAVGFTRGRNDYQNAMGGALSMRRFGWSEALQHDTPLRASDCGGPVVDLDGRVVGFNIARAGRTESYALPTGVVKRAVAHLGAQSAAAPATR